MKSKELIKHLYRVIILIILIGVVAASTSLTAESPKQIMEYRTDEVLLVIDEKLNEFVSADESDRSHKISLLEALADFQTQISDHDIQFDRIDSELNVVRSQIVDWFYENYVSMISEIAQKAGGDIYEVEQYLLVISEEIDRLSENFFSDDIPIEDFLFEDILTEESIGEDIPIEDILAEESISDELLIEDIYSDDIDSFDERLYKAEIYTELINTYEMFADDDFIALRLGANEMRIDELATVINLVEEESIVDRERVAGLYDMINTLIEGFADADRATAIEAGNIIQRFETELSLQRMWFEEHYFSLINEIVDLDREDEYDDVTVKTQIEALELIKLLIESDGLVGDDFLLLISEHIEELIDVYEIELAAIEERIKQRDIAAAAAAAAAVAAAASRRNTSSSSSNAGSRTGSNSNNTSGSDSGSNNNASGSDSGSSNNASGSDSGSNNNTGSNSGSSSASVNNNYPSISSNCREMLARLVRLEAPNESADGKQAVAEVVLNRMVSSRWSHANTVEEVIFDDKWGVQFTVKDLIWTDRGNPSSSDVAAVDRALGGSNVLGRSYVFFNTRPVTQVDVIWIGLHAFSK
ncbi:MAG: cell wall hydrolase [Oscillospiraceae bacterium]|nr:cell wall hydrolase [Oscillospiraceae bacterium]